MHNDQGEATAQLKTLCREWDRAIAQNDVILIAKYMASDWVIIGTEGGITAKADFLNFIAAGDLVHTAMEFQDLRVAVYDTTAIITSKGTSIGAYQGKPFRYFEWSTNVFVQTAGEWKCVLTMLTPAES